MRILSLLAVFVLLVSTTSDAGARSRRWRSRRQQPDAQQLEAQRAAAQRAQAQRALTGQDHGQSPRPDARYSPQTVHSRQPTVAEPNFDRVESMLAAEEKRLQSRLAEINKLRQAALEKQDESRLGDIEKMEQAAIRQYEQRLERIVAGVNAAAERSAGARSRSAATQNPGQQPSTNDRRTWLNRRGR